MKIEISNVWIEALGWTLLHSLWQAALIALLAHGTVAALRSRSAAVRSGAFSAGIAAILIAAGFTFGLKVREAEPIPAAVRSAAAPVQFGEAASLAGTLPLLKDRSLTMRPALPWLVLAWAAGVLLMSTRLIAGALWLRRLRREAIPYADEEWRRKFRGWVQAFGIRPAARLCTTILHESPAVIGHFKPLVLIPAGLVTRLTAEQLEAVILHELMHIRRNDYLMNLMRVCAETVLFFNPAVWWLSRSIRLERELACDQLASEHTGNKVGYAKTLLRLEELQLAGSGQLALAANSGSLKIRVTRLLSPGKPAPAVAAWTGLGCLALLAAGLSFLLLPTAFAVDKEFARFELRSVVERGTPDSEILPFKRLTKENTSLITEHSVARQVLLSNEHFEGVELAYDPVSNRPDIKISLSAEGAAQFAQITKEHIGRQIAIVIDGQIVTAPMVNERIAGGSMMISGSFTEEEARKLIEKLAPKKRAGAAISGETIKKLPWQPSPGKLPSTILQEAREDRQAGRHAEALAKHLWYHTASRNESGQGGVRVSFALSDWVALGQAYPPAMTRLKQLRDETGQALRSGGVEADRFTLFQEYAGINWALQQEEKTAEMYAWLKRQNPALPNYFQQAAGPALQKFAQAEAASETTALPRPREWAEDGVPRGLSEAQVQYVYLSQLVNQLKGLKRADLRKTLPTLYPDSALARYLGELAKAEQSLASIKTDFADEHPEVVRLKDLLKRIDEQIDERIDGVVKGLEVRVAAMKATVEELQKRAELRK